MYKKWIGFYQTLQPGSGWETGFGDLGCELMQCGKIGKFWFESGYLWSHIHEPNSTRTHSIPSTLASTLSPDRVNWYEKHRNKFIFVIFFYLIFNLIKLTNGWRVIFVEKWFFHFVSRHERDDEFGMKTRKYLLKLKFSFFLRLYNDAPFFCWLIFMIKNCIYAKVDKLISVALPTLNALTHSFSTRKSQIWFFPYFYDYFSSTKLMIFILHPSRHHSNGKQRKKLFVNDWVNWGWLNNEKNCHLPHFFFAFS